MGEQPNEAFAVLKLRDKTLSWRDKEASKAWRALSRTEYTHLYAASLSTCRTDSFGLDYASVQSMRETIEVMILVVGECLHESEHFELSKGSMPLAVPVMPFRHGP